MKKKANRLRKRVDGKDKYALLILFFGFYFSLNLINNLVGWILGIAFLIGFLYGIISIYRGEKFVS